MKPAAVCTFFLQGKCTRGSQCKYSHDTSQARAQQQTTTMNAPRASRNTLRPPSAQPFGVPSAQPFGVPSAQPFGVPSAQPFGVPSAQPFGVPSAQPFGTPSAQPFGQVGFVPPAPFQNQPRSGPGPRGGGRQQRPQQQVHEFSQPVNGIGFGGVQPPQPFSQPGFLPQQQQFVNNNDMSQPGFGAVPPLQQASSHQPFGSMPDPSYVPQQHQRPPQQQQICKFFSERGSCKFGDKCRNLHIVANPPQGGGQQPPVFGAQPPAPFMGAAAPFQSQPQQPHGPPANAKLPQQQQQQHYQPPMVNMTAGNPMTMTTGIPMYGQQPPQQQQQIEDPFAPENFGGAGGDMDTESQPFTALTQPQQPQPPQQPLQSLQPPRQQPAPLALGSTRPSATHTTGAHTSGGAQEDRGAKLASKFEGEARYESHSTGMTKEAERAAFEQKDAFRLGQVPENIAVLF